MDITKNEVLKAISNNPQLSDILTPENRIRFAEFTVDGSLLDLQFAIRLMIDGFMDNCGISRTVRTVYYDAGVALFNIFINTESTLAKQLRSYQIECLSECMEMFNELYTKAEYGNYDITIVEPSMYLELCMEECSYNIPVAMKKALCYGIYLLFNELECLGK